MRFIRRKPYPYVAIRLRCVGVAVLIGLLILFQVQSYHPSFTPLDASPDESLCQSWYTPIAAAPMGYNTRSIDPPSITLTPPAAALGKDVWTLLRNRLAFAAPALHAQPPRFLLLLQCLLLL